MTQEQRDILALAKAIQRIEGPGTPSDVLAIIRRAEVNANIDRIVDLDKPKEGS